MKIQFNLFSQYLCPQQLFIQWATTPSIGHISLVKTTILMNHTISSCQLCRKDRGHQIALLRWFQTQMDTHGSLQADIVRTNSHCPGKAYQQQFPFRPTSRRRTILPPNTSRFTGQWSCSMTSAPTSRSLERPLSSSMREIDSYQTCQLTGSLPVLFQNDTFTLSSRWLSHMVLDQKTRGKCVEQSSQASFRNFHIPLDHYEPQTPSNNPLEIANLLACAHPDRLDIEICTWTSVQRTPKAERNGQSTRQ